MLRPPAQLDDGIGERKVGVLPRLHLPVRVAMFEAFLNPNRRQV
jgi:hypothetical protein